MDINQHSRYFFHLLKNFHIVRLYNNFHQHSPIKSNNQPQLGVISKNIRQFKTFLTRSYYYFFPNIHRSITNKIKKSPYSSSKTTPRRDGGRWRANRNV